MTKPIGYWWTAGGMLAEVLKEIPEKREVFGVIYSSAITFDANWWCDGQIGENNAISNSDLSTFIGPTHPGVFVHPKEPREYRPWTQDELAALAARNRLVRYKSTGNILRIMPNDDPNMLLASGELVQYGHSHSGKHYIKLFPCGELAHVPPATIEWRRGE